MASKPVPITNRLNLTMKPGGVTVIGINGSDAIVAGRPDGAIFAGSAQKPVLGRTPDADIMLIGNDGFVANIKPDGTLLLHCGEDKMIFRPRTFAMMETGASEYGSEVIVENLRFLGVELMGWDAPAVSGRDEKADTISVKTTRRGSVRMRQLGRHYTIMCRRDGAISAGTPKRRVLARLPEGDFILSLDRDFTAIIKPNGNLIISTPHDCVHFAPGESLAIASEEDVVLADEMLAMLNTQADEIERDDPVECEMDAPSPAVEEMMEQFFTLETEDPQAGVESSRSSECPCQSINGAAQTDPPGAPSGFAALEDVFNSFGSSATGLPEDHDGKQ